MQSEVIMNNKEEKKVVFTADVDSESAAAFDEIAERNFRSREKHLLFIINKELEFHRNKEEANA